MVHFNWTELIPNVLQDSGNHYIHVATAAVVVMCFCALGVAARVSLGKGEAAITPSGSFSLKGFFEYFTEAVTSLSDSVIGKEGRNFVPMFCAIFFFLLVNNFIGLLPGMSPATDNFNSTLAFGLFSFIVYNFYGIKEHGAAYLKQFTGPLLPLAPFLLCIELVSHMIRPLSLGLRLQGNMMGDHTVLGVFTDLVPYGLPVIFYFLGFFVCFMQAFIFTLLTMVYVSMAISHDH